MEPFFYALCMLIGGIFALSLVVLLIISLGIFILAAFKKWQLAKIISACTFALTLATGVIFTHIFILDPAPEGIFASAFEESVSDDVKNLKCHTLWIGDCHMTWLKFETNVDRFNKLIPSELQQNTDTFNNFSDETGGPNAPDWWPQKTKIDSSYYSLRLSPGKTYGGERTLMTYDPQEHCAYYYFCGWN